MCPLEFRSLAYSFSYQQIWLQPNNIHKNQRFHLSASSRTDLSCINELLLQELLRCYRRTPSPLALLLAKNKMINGAHFVTRAIVRSRWVPLSDWSSWRSSRGCGGGGGRPPGRRRRRRRTVPPSPPRNAGSPLKMRGIGCVTWVRKNWQYSYQWCQYQCREQSVQRWGRWSTCFWKKQSYDLTNCPEKGGKSLNLVLANSGPTLDTFLQWGHLRQKSDSTTD